MIRRKFDAIYLYARRYCMPVMGVFVRANFLKNPKPENPVKLLWNAPHTPSIPVTIISPLEVCKRHHKTYRSHTTHSYLLSIIGYVRLQGHKERYTIIIYTSYENVLAYTLALLPST